MKGKGHEGIDEFDNVNSSTPLMVACETLSDMELFKILCEEGGADVNAVNSDDKLPLTLLTERISKLSDNSSVLGSLKQIHHYLISKGALSTWKDVQR